LSLRVLSTHCTKEPVFRGVANMNQSASKATENSRKVSLMPNSVFLFYSSDYEFYSQHPKILEFILKYNGNVELKFGGYYSANS
jgi:hypothetical protein